MVKELGIDIIEDDENYDDYCDEEYEQYGDRTSNTPPMKKARIDKGIDEGLEEEVSTTSIASTKSITAATTATSTAPTITITQIVRTLQFLRHYVSLFLLLLFWMQFKLREENT